MTRNNTKTIINRLVPWLWVALLIFILTGCAARFRTTYQPPEVTLPEQWQTQPATGERIVATHQWWQVFQDPELERFITLALASNNDLAAATIKVRKASLQAGLEDTNRWPAFSANAGLGVQRDLDSGDDSESTSASVGLSWELDLWGKLAASRDAAQWEARATEADRANTALALVGTTADLYWQIAYLQQAIDASQAGITYARKALEIVRVKYQAGAVSGIEAVQAEQNVESQLADLANLQQQMAEARNGFAVLFDQAPGRVTVHPDRLSDMPMPALDAGIPAAVLGNRPDLRAAEMRLRSLLADADATRTSYYPSLSLTSSLGTSSAQLLDFLANPVAALGAGLTLPFLNWQQAKLNTKIAEATYEQAVVAFRQTLYEALKDVENALSARKYFKAREEALRRSLTLAAKAEQMAETRYRQGDTGIQEWLDQQENRRLAELALALNRYNQLTNMMTLYQALGGDTKLSEHVPQ